MVLYQLFHSASTSRGTSMRPIWSAGAIGLSAIARVGAAGCRSV
jgi:hypothetical protein